MKTTKPEFHLRRVAEDGARGPMEIVALSDLPDDVTASRRGFLGTGLAIASLVSVLGRNGCCDGSEARAGEGRRGSITAHTGAVNALSISPDGTTLASASADKTVKLWDLPGGKHRETFADVPASILSLAIMPGDKVLTAAPDVAGIRLSEIRGGADPLVLSGQAARVDLLALSSDGRHLASRARNSAISLWSLPEGKILKTFTDVPAGVTALALSPDGHTLAQGLNDRSIRLLSLPSGRVARTLRYEGQFASCLAVHSQAEVLAAGFFSGQLSLFTPPYVEPPASLAGHTSRVSALAFSPDGQTLASGDRSGVIILWNRAAGRPFGFLFDPAASRSDGVAYDVTDRATGRTVTYTLPCGSPIPPGAVCTCNCVPGTYHPADVADLTERPVMRPRPRTPRYRTPRYYSGGGGYSGGSSCTCNKVCVCIPVCQAHRLTHEDPVVRTMAEELLLVMGHRESAYMNWAASRAAQPLRGRIVQSIEAVREGMKPDPSRWPGPLECLARLDDADDVVGIMAAQMLQLRHLEFGFRLQLTTLQSRVAQLLERAACNPWFTRVHQR